ncbi:Na/Pi symporter [Fulvivirga sedimenti]|uniref:Na/Pi symporter n=1 Tax=Fulvivirga sedimenti TaxID=2879465 RepID=A0A9X1KXN8_9BACT|nr:Na/Pi symporter [Fulvivirga sedimenti]
MSKSVPQYSLSIRILVILSAVFIFLFSIELMGESFGRLGEEVAESILTATSNPFIGLFIGLLVTALIQSSSTTTSMIVALVAAGSITLSNAVPMIMGANIGTTLTSTIVSLGYIAKRDEFKRAIAAGTVHDFFNILTVLILFPLEYYYGLISSLAQEITSLLGIVSPAQESIDVGFKLFRLIPVTEVIVEKIGMPFVSIALSFVLLFGSIKILSNIISKILMGESQEKLRLFLFEQPFKSFLWGILVTGSVQSSSVTTSLVVPFAATGKVRMDGIMPFILGANIGTTITAFIAAMFKSELVVSIAITHLIINVIGVLIFLPIPFMRRSLIRLAELFGELTARYRITGFMYIILMFFLIPFTLIYTNRDTAVVEELVYTVWQDGRESEKSVLAKVNRKGKERIWGMNITGNEGAQSNIYDIYRDNNIIFINNNFFLINKPGFCWDDEKNRGKFKMCIEEILDEVRINENMTVDSVLIIKKEYYQPEALDSITFKYYLSASEKLLIRTEKMNKHGIIVEYEQLTDIKK